MNLILRDIKLSKLTNIPPVGNASKLDKFWDRLWADMKVLIDPNEGEIKCWKDGYDYYYFSQINGKDRLWCNYDKVWSFFIYDLNLNFTETEELIQYMVHGTINCKVTSPPNIIRVIPTDVDSNLNCKVTTPLAVHLNTLIKVDDILKCKVNKKHYESYTKRY